MAGAALAGLMLLTAVAPRRLVAQNSAARTRQRAPIGPPSTDIYLVPLTLGAALPRVGAPLNVTHRDGYDNQPMFAVDSRSLFYTSSRADNQADIYRYNFSTGLAVPVHRTNESEYSAFPTANDSAITVVRVEADSTQRLWRMPVGDGPSSVMFPNVKPVGYFAQSDDSTWALFVLGSPATLQIAHTGRSSTDTVARNIGRSLHRIPDTKSFSYVQKGSGGWYVMAYDPATHHADTLVRTVSATSEDVVWADATTLLSANGARLYAWRRGSSTWTQIGDFGYAALDTISRLAVSRNGQWLAITAIPQPRSAIVPSRAYPRDKVDEASVKRGIDILAGDAMEGRRTGSPGSARAALWLQAQFKSVGLIPAGDSGTYMLNIPLEIRPFVAIPGANAPASAGAARGRMVAAASWAAWDSLPVERRARGS
ncbi:MAG: hypothetical protein M3Y64_11025, partial [Gemmatimonadota bacterium]|nr:hypothetical protein [Gemmatimonadota bacterium]